MLRSHPDQQLAPLLLAERDLAEARLTAAESDRDAGPRLAAAVAAVRATGNPLELGHALLDEAAWCAVQGDAAGAAGLVDEAASWTTVAAAVAPDEAARPAYEEVYRVYRELYPATREAAHALAAMQDAARS